MSTKRFEPLDRSAAGFGDELYRVSNTREPQEIVREKLDRIMLICNTLRCLSIYGEKCD
jgi:hypothetical protein